MKGQLQEISGLLKIIVAKEMQASATLSPSDFQKHLSEVKTTLQVASITHAEASPKTIEGLQSKIIQSNRSDPQFWSTASALITFRSSFTPLSGLPNCLAASTNKMFATSGTTTSFTGIPLYEDCVLNLDLPLPELSNPPQKRGVTGPDIACKRCVVVYSGGKIPMTDSGLHSVRFIDCSFSMQAPNEPPSKGQSLLIALLESKDAKRIDYSNF